jgi:hypothetical protein
VNTGAAEGIEVKLKVGDAGVVLFKDKVEKVNGEDQDLAVQAVDPAQLVAAKTQLSVLDVARTFLENFSTLYSSFAHCSGDPNAVNYPCNLDQIYNSLAPHFAQGFQENGNPTIWGWICDSDVTTKEECDDLEFDVISLKDVTLINFNPETRLAVVSFNVYENGIFDGTTEFVLQATPASGPVTGFQFKGNQKSFRYWIETSSEHVTETVYENNQYVLKDKYQVNLNLWYDHSAGHSFNDGDTFTMKALSGNQIFDGGNSDTMPLYLVKYPEWETGSCQPGMSFSTTDKPYMRWDSELQKQVNISYAEACPNQPNPCECNSSFDYESTKLVLTEAQVQNMTKIERISLTLASKDVNDEFIIKKPMVVNSFNADKYMPKLSITADNFCRNTDPLMTLNLSAPVGQLTYVSLFYNATKDSQWHHEGAFREFWEDNLKEATYTPIFENIPAGSQLDYRHLFLESEDDLGQRFVRRINCSTIP